MTQNICKKSDLAMVVRNTTGHPCIDNFIGQAIRCDKSYLSIVGPVWLLPGQRACPKCKTKLVGFLDADLQPLRPPRGKAVVVTTKGRKSCTWSAPQGKKGAR